MNPALMMMLASLASAGAGALTGSKGEKGSTYGKNQLSMIDQILQNIKGEMGGPQQDIGQQQGFQQGNQFFNSLFNDPDFFNNIEAPAMRQLNEDILPGIATRYGAMGSGGSTGSTGFRNATARAGTDLATNLSAQRTGMQQGALPQMLQYSQAPISNWMTMLQQAMNPTQNTFQGPTAGGFGSLAAPFAQGAASIYGQRAGQMAGNPGQSPLTY